MWTSRRRSVAAHHPEGAKAVFTGERGSAVTAMAQAFSSFLKVRDDVAGILGAGGSGAVSLVAPAMRQLPVGVPKTPGQHARVGDVRPFVGRRRYRDAVSGGRCRRSQSDFAPGAGQRRARDRGMVRFR